MHDHFFAADNGYLPLTNVIYSRATQSLVFSQQFENT